MLMLTYMSWSMSQKAIVLSPTSAWASHLSDLLTQQQALAAMRFCSGLVLELMSMLIAKYMSWSMSQKAIVLSPTSA